MNKEEHDKIIDFVNSEDYMLLNSYISKPYEETIIEQDKEIERLNNIIDELEKDLLDSIEYWENQEKLWIEEGFIKFGGEANNKIIFKGVLKKLKKLKEGKE